MQGLGVRPNREVTSKTGLHTLWTTTTVQVARGGHHEQQRREPPPHRATLGECWNRRRGSGLERPVSVACTDHYRDTPADDPRAHEIDTALDELPPHAHAEIRRQLARAIAEHERTGELAAFVHFLDSLRLTAALSRDPDYVRGTARADAEDPSQPGVDVARLVARVRKQR